MRVALIEDEEALRDLYQREFLEVGYILDGFATGEEGLAGVAQNQYDAILLDLMLPGVNGLEILKQIKLDDKLKDIPVIILTNLGQDEVIKQGFKLGADSYLIKSSNSPKEVVAEVQNIIRRKSPVDQSVKPGSA